MISVARCLCIEEDSLSIENSIQTKEETLTKDSIPEPVFLKFSGHKFINAIALLSSLSVLLTIFEMSSSYMTICFFFVLAEQQTKKVIKHSWYHFECLFFYLCFSLCILKAICDAKGFCFISL